ncbi:MAG TPA: glycosyltransferase, partial [Herpetosiphonaceae bacterium]
MRILFLTPYPAYPPHGGGVQRMYQLIRQLSKRHEVWCLSLASGPEAVAAAQPLAEWCHLTLAPAPRRSLAERAASTLLSPLPDMALRAPIAGYRAALLNLLREVPFDVVQAESIEMAAGALLARRHGAWAALDEWNAEYLLQRRAALTDLRAPRRAHAALYSLIQWRKLAAYERSLSRRLDQIFVVSREDAAALRRLDARRAPGEDFPVIPNGVDTAYFAPPQERAIDPDLLLFTGTLDFRPNIDALIWFVREVLPLIRRERPGARLRIVGRSPAPAVLALARPGVVEVTGAVPDVRPSFAEAAVYVLPMRMGGGVRLKLLEALAAETPLVSTAMGADGVEGLRHGEHCLLADAPAEFAQAVLGLLRDRAEAARL